MTYMRDAAAVLVRYLRSHNEPQSYAWGRVSVGLEIVTLIKTLEDIPVASVAEKEGTISCLHTMLVEQNLIDCYEMYDILASWRRTSLVEIEREPSESVVASVRSVPDPLGFGVSRASDAVALPSEHVPPRGKRVSERKHPRQREMPKPWRGEQLDGEG